MSASALPGLVVVMLAVGVMLGPSSPAAASPADDLRFVSCPIYRDTDAGRKSGCWITDDPASGRRYDVSLAPTKPDWNRAILVEGRIAATQDDACGGVLLDPVRVSVLEEACTRAMLPAEHYPGRAFVLPERNVRPLSESRVPPPTPYENRTFDLVFDYRRSFIVYQLDDYVLDQAITYIRAVNLRQVIVTGHAATEPVEVSGRMLAEPADLARERAEVVAESLRRLGVPAELVQTTWKVGASPEPVEAADGLIEPSRRRVSIEVLVR